MLFDGVSHQLPDADPVETSEWLDAFDDIVDVHGRTRARYLLMRILERAGQKLVDFPATVHIVLDVRRRMKTHEPHQGHATVHCHPERSA